MPDFGSDLSTRQKYLVWLSACLLALALFAIDIHVPLGLASGVPYALLFLSCWWFGSFALILFLAGLSVSLTILGYFLSEPGAPLWVALTNRAFAIAVILLSAFLVAQGIKMRRQYHDQLKGVKEREQELETYRQRQQLHFKNSPLGAIEWDTQFNVLEWNVSAEKIFGFSAEEIKAGDAQGMIIPPEVVPLAEQTWRNLLEQKGGERSIYYNLCKDGRKILCSWYNTALIDSAGKVIGVTSLVEDITERNVALQQEQVKSRVLTMLAETQPLDDTLLALLEGMEFLIPGSLCSLVLVDEDATHIVRCLSKSLPPFYANGFNGLAIEDEMGSCGTAVYRGERVIVEDIANHPYWEPYREITQKAGLAACWSEPIVDVKGHILGTIAIYFCEPTVPRSYEISLLEEAAKLAAIAFDKNNAEQAMRLSTMVYENSLEGILVTDADRNIVSVNPSFEKITGYSAEEVIGKNPNILSSQRHDDKFFEELYSELRERGCWQGEIWNRKKDGEEYAELLSINTIYDANNKIQRYIGIFTDITQNKKAEELIWRHANFDMLTGLPNRRQFMEQLSRATKLAERNDYRLAVIFIDLDKFKEVNDQVGHHMGDELLKAAALRIGASVRETDLVARLGGDEFTVIIEQPEPDSTKTVDQVAQHILTKLSKPFYIGDEKFFVSASIGISYYPDNARTIDELIKCADQAMYHVKAHGRNGVFHYTQDIQENALRRLRMIKDLREAVRQQQFHLCYQPIVDLHRGEIVRTEALLRWEHPLRGLISPEHFISLAEEVGLIGEIGSWVMQQAVGQAHHWIDKYDPRLQISINVSPIQLKENHQLCEQWVSYLQEQNLDPSCLALEITEGLLVSDSEEIQRQLSYFRDHGVNLSLDDFGTGYSSLSYLKKFNMDILKIDRSFVTSLTDQSEDLVLCEAIIVMAHKLGMKVIAEGIETCEQKTLLAEAGCDFGQGHYFSPAVRPEQFEKILEAGQLVSSKAC